MSSPQILLSRRALLQLKPKYPKHFTKPKSTKKADTKETPWPFYMQVAGYTAAAAAVPYTIGVIIKESRDVREYLEGDYMDDKTDDTIGRKVVGFVRWFWGEEDDIPYVEYLERHDTTSATATSKNNNESSTIAYSLDNEEKQFSRRNQDRIEKDVNSNIKVLVESEGMMKDDVFKGNEPLENQLLHSYANDDHDQLDHLEELYVSIQDDVDEVGAAEGGGMLTNSSLEDIPFHEQVSTAKEIGNMSTIYAMWNYFPPQGGGNSKASSSTESSSSSSSSSSSASTIPSFDSTMIRIEELQYNMAELQKSMADPMCTRDRDDMDREMREMRSEVGSLKRQKRMAKLKKLISF